MCCNSVVAQLQRVTLDTQLHLYLSRAINRLIYLSKVINNQDKYLVIITFTYSPTICVKPRVSLLTHPILKTVCHDRSVICLLINLSPYLTTNFSSHKLRSEVNSRIDLTVESTVKSTPITISINYVKPDKYLI